MDTYLIVQVVSSVLFTIGIFINYMLVRRESVKVAVAAEAAAIVIRETAEEVSKKLEAKAAVKSHLLEEKAERVSHELEEAANGDGV